jgi:hypothetical protein
MAIAPSKLGRLVAQEWPDDARIVRALRERRLVREDVSDDDLRATVEEARAEDSALPSGRREFNSPNERVRVFLTPYLTRKGASWAVPLDSLKLPDDEA